MSILSEFKEFAVKGNVIDLAVGVIIGAAFGKIVDSLVADIIMPLVGVVFGKLDFSNLYVVLGTAPAGVAQAANGAAAMARIVAADAPLLAFRDPGSFSIAQALFRRAGVRPGPRQQLYDDAESPQSVLVSAARQGAYAVVGHIPVASGKMPSHGLKVLLHGDPAMHRVYVLVEPGPAHPANAERRRLARRLADYLLSARGQADLRAADREAGGPWVFALTTSGPAR